jgi:hypothetical protein
MQRRVIYTMGSPISQFELLSVSKLVSSGVGYIYRLNADANRLMHILQKHPKICRPDTKRNQTENTRGMKPNMAHCSSLSLSYPGLPRLTDAVRPYPFWQGWRSPAGPILYYNLKSMLRHQWVVPLSMQVSLSAMYAVHQNPYDVSPSEGTLGGAYTCYCM